MADLDQVLEIAVAGARNSEYTLEWTARYGIPPRPIPGVVYGTKNGQKAVNFCIHGALTRRAFVMSPLDPPLVDPGREANFSFYRRIRRAAPNAFVEGFLPVGTRLEWRNNLSHFEPQLHILDTANFVTPATLVGLVPYPLTEDELWGTFHREPDNTFRFERDPALPQSFFDVGANVGPAVGGLQFVDPGGPAASIFFPPQQYFVGTFERDMVHQSFVDNARNNVRSYEDQYGGFVTLAGFNVNSAVYRRVWVMELDAVGNPESPEEGAQTLNIEETISYRCRFEQRPRVGDYVRRGDQRVGQVISQRTLPGRRFVQFDAQFEVSTLVRSL